MNWLSFFIGVLIGGGIIYYFWQLKVQEAKETERMLRQRLAEAENETRQIRSHVDNVKRQEEQLITCQTELQKKIQENQQVTGQLSATETQVRSLREQLAAAGTKGDQTAATEAQLQTLRDQLADAEHKVKIKGELLVAAKKQIRDLRWELADAQFNTETQIQTLREQLAATKTTPSEAAPDQPMPVMAAEVTAPVQSDDLTKIEGVGPKVSQVLQENGIHTFAQLAQTDVSRLRTILQDAGPRFKMMEPESWPEQAGLAASGNWDALNKLQDELDGGKYRR